MNWCTKSDPEHNDICYNIKTLRNVCSLSLLAQYFCLCALLCNLTENSDEALQLGWEDSQQAPDFFNFSIWQRSVICSTQWDVIALIRGSCSDEKANANQSFICTCLFAVHAECRFNSRRFWDSHASHPACDCLDSCSLLRKLIIHIFWLAITRFISGDICSLSTRTLICMT